jgi:hypothetical protein
MDRRQPLILIFVILVFGVAVGAAIWVFGTKNLEAYRSGIVNDLTHIASDAYLFRMKPAALGGGGGSFGGYAIPAQLRTTGFGVYEVSESSSGDTLILRATATRRLGTVEARVETTGFLKILGYTGDLVE